MDKTYFYTETAFHHEGDMEFMKKLIDATFQSGAVGIKFQVMTNTSDFISTKHKAYDVLNNYCFNIRQWKEIFSYTIEKGLDIIMMPLNGEAFDLIKEFHVKYLDIHSVSFFDDLLLKNVKDSGLEIILGVGGRTLAEIEEKKIYFGSKLKSLMVGFQAFPSKIEEVKIGKISYLKRQFPELHIGYADHTAYDNEYALKSNEYARILGATIFEKHITIQEGVERVDYSAAVSVSKIKLIIEKLNFIDEYIMTDFEKSFEFTLAENNYRERQIRCVAKSNLKAGQIFTKDMILLKLIDDQENTFNRVENLLGKKLLVDLDADCVVKLENIK